MKEDPARPSVGWKFVSLSPVKTRTCGTPFHLITNDDVKGGEEEDLGRVLYGRSYPLYSRRHNSHVWVSPIHCPSAECTPAVTHFGCRSDVPGGRRRGGRGPVTGRHDSRFRRSFMTMGTQGSGTKAEVVGCLSGTYPKVV